MSKDEMAEHTGVLEDVVIGRVEIAGIDRQIELDGLESTAFDGPADPAQISALIEALLLSAPEPATVELLAQGAGVPASAVEQALSHLSQQTSRGWTIQWHGPEIQLVTAPLFARYVRRFLGLEREVRLSGAALEALAVIAYQQPVTRSDIESVRGVDCTGVLATLLSRGLIEQTGRAEVAGLPYQYGVTADFLKHFGMQSLADLPDLGRSGELESAVHLSGMIQEARMAHSGEASGSELAG